LKGVALRAVCNEVLWQYSAQDSQSTHERGRSPVTQRRYIAITLFTTSDCPSVCGWNVVLMRSFIPAMLKRSRQTLTVNTGSRSLTMDDGNLCRCTMPSKKARATEFAVYG
jgi:hypothetical protein